MDAADAAPGVIAEHDAAPELPRLHRLLDSTGLFCLVWALVLGWLPRHASDGPVRQSMAGPADPQADIAGFTARDVLLAGITVLLLPLVLSVLTSFGRTGPAILARQRAAIPLVAGLALLTAWRFVVGFALNIGHGVYFGISSLAGIWDGAAIVLAASAAGLLTVRRFRVDRVVQAVAGTTAVLTAAAGLLVGELQFGEIVRQTDRDVLLGLASMLPGQVTALACVPLAAALVWGLQRSKPWAAPGLLVWGAAIWLLQLVPENLVLGLNSFGDLRAGWIVTGLDWAQSALAIGAAVLVAPVIMTYRSASTRTRGQMLSGGLAVLAVLGAAFFFGQLLTFVVGWSQLETIPGRQSAPDLSVAALLLIAALLLAQAAVQVRSPRPVRLRQARLLVSLAAALIVVPVLLYVVIEKVTRSGPDDAARGYPVIPPLELWTGWWLALTVVLPVLMVVLVRSFARVR